MIFHWLTVSLVCLSRRSSMRLLPAFLVLTHGALAAQSDLVFAVDD